MYNTNVSVCPQTIFDVKSVGENTDFILKMV